MIISQRRERIFILVSSALLYSLLFVSVDTESYIVWVPRMSLKFYPALKIKKRSTLDEKSETAFVTQNVISMLQ